MEKMEMDSILNEICGSEVCVGLPQMENVILKKLVLAPIVQSIILGVTTFSTYGISFYKGHVSAYLPFISETGAFSPEMPVFSLGLFFGSVFGSFMALAYFIIICKNCPQHIRLNIAGLVTGVVAMIGLGGVAAFPMTTVYALHLMFAGIYFFASCLYFIVVTMITSRREEGNDSILKRSRRALTISLIILQFLLVFIFPVALIRWDKANTDLIPALKTPENEGFTLVFIASILEWTAVLVILLYNLTFTSEFKNYALTISAVEESPEISPTEGDPADREGTSSQKPENI